jgi:ABC-type multidrug transport system fused ATPase/permease subunit
MTLAASKQTGWKRFTSWLAGPTGLAATVLFLVVAVLLEVIIIYSSMALGLRDMNPIVWNVASVTITISPLFHILPLTVIIVLFASWIYLTRNVAYIPTTKAQPQKTARRPPPSLRRYEKKSFKRLRRFVNRLNKGIEETGRKIRERIANTRLVKYFEQHVAGKTVFKSAWTVVLSFLVLALAISLVVYPFLLPDAVDWLGGGNSLLAGFITWTVGAATAIGQVLSPIGWIAASINSGLTSIATGFRNGVIDFTTPIVQPLVSLDFTGKYMLVQNVAAWSSALIALYAGQPKYRRR